MRIKDIRFQDIIEQYINNKNEIIMRLLGEVLVPSNQINVSGFKGVVSRSKILSDIRLYITIAANNRNTSILMTGNNCPYCAVYFDSVTTDCGQCPMHLAGNGCENQEIKRTYAKVINKASKLSKKELKTVNSELIGLAVKLEKELTELSHI